MSEDHDNMDQVVEVASSISKPQVSGYLTTADLAKHYGNVAESTIWRWIQLGIIPAGVKIGGRRLHRKSDHIDAA